MKFPGIFLFILILGCRSKKEFSDCRKYHVGSFVYRPMWKNKAILLYRNENHQVEVDSATGAKQEEIIDWIDDCHYRTNKVVETRVDSATGITGQVVEVDQSPKPIAIIGGTDKYYVCEISRRNRRPYIDTVWRIK